MGSPARAFVRVPPWHGRRGRARAMSVPGVRPSSRRAHAPRMAATGEPRVRAPPPALERVRRFVVLSDLHVRRETAAVCIQALRRTHREAVARGAGVLFLGDWWHSRGALPVEPLNMVLRELEAWSVPVVLLPGNHDLVSRAGEALSLTAMATTLGADKCVVVTRPEIMLDALFLPYMHSAVQMKAVLRAAASMPDPVRTVFCHAEVAGARLANRIVSRPSPRVVEPADFDFHRVYSGHLHRPHLVPNTNVRYAGSPYQVSAAEYGQSKSLLVLDRHNGWAVEETIPIDIGTRHFFVSIPARLREAAPVIRSGDSVVISTLDPSDPQVLAAVSKYRREGARIEVRHCSPEEIFNGSEVAGALTFKGRRRRPGPRISTTSMSPMDLFQEYARRKKLDKATVTLGSEIVSDLTTRVLAGKDVHIQFENVVMEGFGSFLERVEYPLDDRGIVLIIGQDGIDGNGNMTGRTNGTGKSTLAMAPLWALSGKTDPRPDGSADKGVSEEMVHDNASVCVVILRLRLTGDRIVTLLQQMMTPSELKQSGLENPTSNGVSLTVTRSSTRSTKSNGRNGYKLGLTLHVNNGTDLTTMDIRKTQSRLDSLVNTSLLPHTTFFAQHTAAGRGLLDGTDSTLKNHLALIFPLDIWGEARQSTKDRKAKFQNDLAGAEGGCAGARDASERMQSSADDARTKVEAFESTRKLKASELSASLQELFKSGPDSNIIVESSADAWEEVERVTNAICNLSERNSLTAQEHRERLIADIQCAEKELKHASGMHERISRLSTQSTDWEQKQNEKRKTLEDALKTASASLDLFSSNEQFEKKRKDAADELHAYETELEQLTSVSISMIDGVSNPPDVTTAKGEGCRTPPLSPAIQRIETLMMSAASLREQFLQLEAAHDGFQSRIRESDTVELVHPDASSTCASEFEATNGAGHGVAGSVVCDRCLRPFEDEMYDKARQDLLAETESVFAQMVATEQKWLAVSQDCRLRSQDLRQKLSRRKKLATDRFSELRHDRDGRQKALDSTIRLKEDLRNAEAEGNLYADELSALLEHAGLQMADDVVANSRIAVKRAQRDFDLAKTRRDEYKPKERPSEAEAAEAEAAERKAALRCDLDAWKSLHTSAGDLEKKLQGVLSEKNPHSESLETCLRASANEKQVALVREIEASNIKKKLESIRLLDVAFGQRGIPSFVLEDGLHSLETRATKYLEILSAGELSLHLEAFSESKSGRKGKENEKLETISKRAFVRKRNGDICERQLRQLSGGQRRRCSLAFALAFAELAAERAGYRSSLLVLDEPLQFLDAEGRRRVAALIPSLLNSNLADRDSILMVTQDEAQEVAGVASGGTDVVIRDDDQSTVSIDAVSGVAPDDE